MKKILQEELFKILKKYDEGSLALQIPKCITSRSHLTSVITDHLKRTNFSNLVLDKEGIFKLVKEESMGPIGCHLGNPFLTLCAILKSNFQSN